MNERREPSARGSRKESYRPGPGEARAAEPAPKASSDSNGRGSRPELERKTIEERGDLPREMVTIYRLYGIPLDYRSVLFD